MIIVQINGLILKIPWRLDLIPGKFIYDEIDIEAYKKKKGQRVSWSPYEDSLVMNPSFLLDEINQN